MSHFLYKAVDRAGGRVAGTIEAMDRKTAVAGLVDRGHFVTELIEKGASAVAAARQPQAEGIKLPSLGGRRVRSKDILAITTQLSTAIRAGLPLLNCLELIGNQQRRPAMRKMFDELVHSVSSGRSLSEAMAAHGHVFGPLYLSMIRVGETGGILEQTSAQLASILGREDKIKTNLKNASAYPIFVLSLGLVSVTIIVTFILPKILATVSGTAAMLPLPTKILLMASDSARSLFTTIGGWAVIALTIGALWFFRHWTKTAGRLQWDSFKLNIPILGPVLRTISVGRFARTLGALTQGGVTILEALGVVRDTLGNELLARQIDDVAEKVKRGESLADPLEECGYFPPLLVQIVSIGEQTGKLDELLLNAADTFDSDADSAIARFMAIFPAILILLLALLVGFIIIATLLPIMVMQLGGVR